MVKKNKGDRRYRILKTSSLQWIDTTMADLEEGRRLQLVYDANDFDVLGERSVGLLKRMQHGVPLLPSPGMWKQYVGIR